LTGLRAILMFFLLLAGALPARAIELRGIGATHLKDGSAAIVIDATAVFAMRASALANPPRLMLDLGHVKVAAQPNITTRGALIERLDAGLQEKGQSSRLVVHLAKPALAEAVDIIPGPVGVRVIIRLREQSKSTFLEAAEATRDQVLAVVQEDLNAIDLVTTGSSSKPVIVLDPGHGGVDPGAVTADGKTEKELVLAYALALRDALNATGQFDIVMTRDSDVAVSLNNRIRLARERKAALFVSLHADSLSDEHSVRGASVYTLADRASDARSARLADRENAVDATFGLAAGDDDQNVSDILFDLTRRETRSFSNRFAEALVRELGVKITINKTPRRFAGFRVLTAPDVPSVLLELGFLSSADDAMQLSDPAWRATAAKAAANAVEDFLMEPVETLPMSANEPESAAEEGDQAGEQAGRNTTQQQ
jgi:N-acetylmuramoyl-L-alanine amidase